jgi:DMSO/TMAO reductase YedYZ molybdopterin-dependent catalytic subunit
MKGTACILALSTALLRAQNTPVEAKLVISGDVTAPQTLTLADLAAMPHETATLDEGPTKVQYRGVPLQDILKKAAIAPGPSMGGKNLMGYVIATGHDGYQVIFSLNELDPDLGNARAIVADQRDGKPLTGNQGPLRLIVATDKKPSRAVRMLEKIEVVRIGSNRIAELIKALHTQAWAGAWNHTDPTHWNLNLTEPMAALLKIGPAAQEQLLARLTDPMIADQVVLLLGGVGDERSVRPIIEEMGRASELPGKQRKNLLIAGSVALTNITVADVIWSSWWKKNEATFHVREITQSRRYSNYPNYGIYRGMP